ncbi:fibroblast growth factor receptor 2-like isoform X2 [Montipora foliosa]|uniref:fibroblast growth factor receptor 2-like isoform X2 n=1 Tax=Montipora foliosa TaxID=591990 RepID=UPI0035F152D4
MHHVPFGIRPIMRASNKRQGKVAEHFRPQRLSSLPTSGLTTPHANNTCAASNSEGNDSETTLLKKKFLKNCHEYTIHNFDTLTRQQDPDWSQSQADCSKNGGHLVCIEHKDELDFLVHKLKELELAGTSEYFIGLQNQNSEWTWICNTNISVTPRKPPWSTGQPSGNGNCAKMYFHTKRGPVYDDIPCEHYKKSYICERRIDPPSNIRASSDLNITAPANLTLNCSANGKPEPTITWTRLSDNTEVTMPLSITGRQDAGDYRCTADNGVGSSLTKDVSIIVLYPPSNIRASSNLNITAPANLTLNCSANGKPEPTINWTRLSDNTEVTMPLSITGRQDAGDYRCTADNGVGSSLSKDVSIIVLYPPSNIRASSDLNITAPANLTLNCSANGKPEPTITWTRLSDNTEVTMPLSITGRQDAGDYRCTADNGVGSSLSKDVSIIVLRDNTWIIVGGVLGAVALSVIIAVTVWCVRKKEYSNETKGTGGQKRAYQESAYDNAPGNTHLAEMVNVGYQQPTPRNDLQEGQYAPLNPSTRSWEVPRHHVTIEKIIGKGAFGQVAKATADGLRGMPQKTLVAVKMTKAGAPESDKKDLLSELEVMQTLKPHPHVIKLIGCVTQSEPLLVLIEYVPFGDLLGYLRKSRGLHDTYYKDPDIKPQTSLTSQQLMKFAWQIADGMKYLSSRFIIHRDLAARNVLVGERETCKVTDFGMARDVRQENIYERKTKGRLPVKWTAYEALMFGTYTTKSDVWSFGVLLYEIFTIGGSPYPRMDGRKVANLLQEGYRMPKPQHVDNELYKIMISCWLEDSNARPTFLDLKNKLKNMENQHKRLINMDIYDNTQLYANVEDLAA